MSLNYLDPDEEEKTPSMSRAAATPKTPLQKRVFKALRKSYFGPGEKKEWRDATGKSVGESDTAALERAWIIHIVEEVEKSNARSAIVSWKNFIARLNNGDRKAAWIKANREKILESRKKQLKESLIAATGNLVTANVLVDNEEPPKEDPKDDL